MKKKLKYPKDFQKIDTVHFTEGTISEFATDILTDLRNAKESGLISTRELGGGDTRIQGEKRGNHIQVDVYRSVERYEATIEANNDELSYDMDNDTISTINEPQVVNKSLIQAIINFIKVLFKSKGKDE